MQTFFAKILSPFCCRYKFSSKKTAGTTNFRLNATCNICPRFTSVRKTTNFSGSESHFADGPDTSAAEETWLHRGGLAQALPAIRDLGRCFFEVRCSWKFGVSNRFRLVISDIAIIYIVMFNFPTFFHELTHIFQMA